MRFEEADRGGEKMRLARAPAKFICTDSGQVDEPLGASSVTKRCRERGEG